MNAKPLADVDTKLLDAIRVDLIGVNLYGNVGKFVRSDTDLMKFYRSIRRRTSEEHAVYVYLDLTGVQRDNMYVNRYVRDFASPVF